MISRFYPTAEATDKFVADAITEFAVKWPLHPTTGAEKWEIRRLGALQHETQADRDDAEADREPWA